MLTFDKYINLRAQVATLKYQLQLAIINQLSVGRLIFLVEYVDVEFHSVNSSNVEI